MVDVSQIIESEARSHRTVLIRMRSKTGEVTVREIEPYGFRAGREDYLLCFYCLLRKDTRTTAIKSILEATPTGNSFVPRWVVEF